MKTSTKIYMVLTGILLIALGVLCICNDTEALVSLTWLVGIFAIAASITTFMFYLDSHAFLFNSGSILLTAIAQFIVGILFIGNDFIVASYIPYFFAIWIMLTGINGAIHSFDFKKVGFVNWWVLLILGIIGAVIGIIIFRYPVFGTKLMAILIGAAVILNGLSYIIAVFGIHKFETSIERMF